MLVDAMKDLWVCSCGNWVDGAFEWCPDCCQYKFTYHYRALLKEEAGMKVSS